VYFQSDLYYALYNDEHPYKTDSDTVHGHTKGVQLFDATSGLWLIHSVPKFPPADVYAYPITGTKYGQSMLCVTFDTKRTLPVLGEC
jgi:deoxyribonuclease-2